MKLINVVKSLAVAAAILCASHASAQDVELATNLGFEDPIGDVGEETPGQWNPFNAGGNSLSGTGTTDPFEGSNHAVISIDGDDGSFAGFQYQVDGITAGETYTFSFNARSEGVNLGGVDAELRFEFLNESGGFVGGQFDNNAPVVATDTYAPFSQTLVAPIGATSLRAVVAVQSFGAGLDPSNAGGLFIDNTSIQGPPIGTPPGTPPGPPGTPGPVMELGVNLSFEEPIGEPGEQTPGQWNPFNNDGTTFAGVDTTAPLSGATHGVASIDGDDNSFAGFVQQVDNIVPGEDYTFSLNARSEGLNLEGIDAEFRIEFLDVNGNFAEDQFANNAPVVVTDTYATFTQTNAAPEGATSLRAVIAVQSFGGGVDPSNAGALFIDDTSIQGSVFGSPVLLGDVNLSGDVTFLDIAPFIDILSTPGAFQAEADINDDGAVTFLDIQPFIDILSGA